MKYRLDIHVKLKVFLNFRWKSSSLCKKYNPTIHYFSIQIPWNIPNDPEVNLQMLGQLARAQNCHQTHLGLLQMTVSYLEISIVQTSPPPHLCIHSPGALATVLTRCICLSIRCQGINSKPSVLKGAASWTRNFKSFNQGIQKGYLHSPCPHQAIIKVYYNLKSVKFEESRWRTHKNFLNVLFGNNFKLTKRCKK